MHADNTQENKSQSLVNSASQKQIGGESTFQLIDNRSGAVAQRKLQEMANNSPQVSQLKAFREMANNSPQVTQIARLRAVANNTYTVQDQHPIQKKENNTGLPDHFKTGMDNRPEVITQSRENQTSESGECFSSPGVIQLITPDELREMGDAQNRFMTKVKPPTSGMNVWSVELPVDLGPPDHIDGTAILYILGTQHATEFGQIHQAGGLLKFLTSTNWNEVYTEIGNSGLPFKATNASIEQALEVEAAVRKEPEKSARTRAIASKKIEGFSDTKEPVSTPIDEAASRFAVRGQAKQSLALETKSDRDEAGIKNKEEGANTLPGQQEDRFDHQQTHTISEAYKRGNEHKIWEFQQDTLREGRDIQDTEERNKRWVTSQQGRLSNLKDGEKILWIVGASHVPGLLTRLDGVFPGAYIRSVGGVHDEAEAAGSKHPYGKPQEAIIYNQ